MCNTVLLFHRSTLCVLFVSCSADFGYRINTFLVQVGKHVSAVFYVDNGPFRCAVTALQKRYTYKGVVPSVHCIGVNKRGHDCQAFCQVVALLMGDGPHVGLTVQAHAEPKAECDEQ